jgi:hypothetical protein
MIWEQALSPANAFADYDIQNRFRISPSRKSLLALLRHKVGYHADLLNIETSSIVATWEEEQSVTLSAIADHSFIGFCGQPQQMCIRGIDQSWRPFRPAGLDSHMTDPYHSSAAFSNDNTVVIESGNEMAAVNLDGTILFQVKLEKNQSFDRPVASNGGERFTVIESQLTGVNIEFLDLYKVPRPDRVVVYSVPERKAVYSLKENGTWESPPSALSPDGALLAVVVRGVLTVHKLPPSSAQY